MFRNYRPIILVFVLAVLASSGMTYYEIQDGKVCDELVILNDGS